MEDLSPEEIELILASPPCRHCGHRLILHHYGGGLTYCAVDECPCER